MKGKSSPRNLLVPLLAPLGVLVVLLTVSRLDLSQQLENVTVDWRFKAREPYDPPADPRILLVGIGEYSIKVQGRWEEWTRSVHANFLETLTSRAPAVVAYDFFFSEPSKDPGQDDAFANMIELIPGAVTGAVADDTKPEAPPYHEASIGKTLPFTRVTGDRSMLVKAPNGLVPIQRLREGAWTGFVNSPPSQIDGIRRKNPMVVEFGGNVYPSFVLQILMQLEGVGFDEIEIVLGKSIVITNATGNTLNIPIDERGFMNLNYRGKAAFEPIEYLGLKEWLEEFETTGVWPESRPAVEGQVVVIGQMAEGLTDFGRTPFSAREPLVLVQAVALNNILQNDYLRIIPLWKILVGFLPLAWGTLFFLRKSPVVWAAVVPIVVVIAYGGIDFVLFWKQSLQLPVFLPVVGFLLVHGHALTDRIMLEMRAKSRIKNLFGTYVSPEVVESMVSSGEDPKLGGQTAEITAFFSDIQGFSSFSEQLGPERLVTLMIDYLTAMTDILIYRGGTLDKYIGDAIVGMFGAPLHFPDHAYRACASTIEMHRQLGELREKWRREGGWPDIVYQMQARIGLNTGPAVIGNMGSPRRFNYTMMGDTVNLAARCESGAKSYGVYTMVSGETRLASVNEKDDIVFRYLDKIVVKGRTQPVEMYEVMGFTDELTPEAVGCIEIYSGGIEKYLARDWVGAVAAFEKSSKLEPFQPGFLPGVHDNPSLVMIARCSDMKVNPPAEDWDGRYVMKSK